MKNKIKPFSSMRKLFPCVLVLLVLVGCTTLPEVQDESSALLVIARERVEERLPTDSRRMFVYVEGMEPIRISFDRDGLFLVSLPAGEYRVGEGQPYNLLAGSVTLHPQTIAYTGRGYRDGSETGRSIQQKAMQSLTSIVGFEQWLGRAYIGFGPYQPRSYLAGAYYQLGIDALDASDSQVIDAGLYIDGEYWGATPREIQIVEGRYMVEVQAEGYESWRQMVEVSGDVDLVVKLGALADGKSDGEGQNLFSVVVTPFVPDRPEAQDLYGSVIAETIGLNFADDSRMQLVSMEEQVAGKLDAQFLAAEKAGADLLVAGTYDLQDNSLLVDASLYDVRTRRVKYANIYITEAGLAVFSSIDDLSAEFVAESGRVLPEPGQAIVEQQIVMSPEILSYERSMYRKEMVRNRLDNFDLLVIGLSAGRYSDDLIYTDEDQEIQSEIYLGEGGYSPSIIEILQLAVFSNYVRAINQWVSFVSGLEVNQHVVRISAHSGSIGSELFSDTLVNSYLISAYAGPEFCVRTEKADFFLRPVFKMAYNPGFSWEHEGQEQFLSALLYTGSALSLGGRYYYYTGRNRPVFAETGVSLNLFQFRSNAETGTVQSGAGGKFYFSVGVGL